MVYLKMHVENVYIKCSIDDLERPKEQLSLSAKIYTGYERFLQGMEIFGTTSLHHVTQWHF